MRPQKTRSHPSPFVKQERCPLEGLFVKLPLPLDHFSFAARAKILSPLALEEQRSPPPSLQQARFKESTPSQGSGLPIAMRIPRTLSKRSDRKMKALAMQGGGCGGRMAVWIFGLGLLFEGILSGASEPIVFAAYNLENYAVSAAPNVRSKSVSAREAVAETVGEVRPDILEVCEVASPEALEELCGRLRERGMNFEHKEWVEGPDPDRHLALLSRVPIFRRDSLPRVSFELEGTPQLVRRGFLDVTVRVNAGYELRLVGVHLKSRLPVPAGEELIRRREAELLRRHVDTILMEEPGVNLLVYGDFNDTREQPVMRHLLGPMGGPFSLHEVPVEDAQGQRWAHHRQASDVYSRIDFLLVNRALRREVTGVGRISSPKQWRRASDHRLISMAILPENR